MLDDDGSSDEVGSVSLWLHLPDTHMVLLMTVHSWAPGIIEHYLGLFMNNSSTNSFPISSLDLPSVTV